MGRLIVSGGKFQTEQALCLISVDSPKFCVSRNHVCRSLLKLQEYEREHQREYWVTGQDVAQETGKWAEWAALASAADSANFYVSCATSCPVTQ